MKLQPFYPSTLEMGNLEHLDLGPPIIFKPISWDVEMWFFQYFSRIKELIGNFLLSRWPWLVLEKLHNRCSIINKKCVAFHINFSISKIIIVMAINDQEILFFHSTVWIFIWFNPVSYLPQIHQPMLNFTFYFRFTPWKINSTIEGLESKTGGAAQNKE